MDQLGLFVRPAEPLPIAVEKPKPVAVVLEKPPLTLRDRARYGEHHADCDSSALRASWPTPDRFLSESSLSEPRLLELVDLFESQLGRRL